ncbi:unnamed protein product [Ilex paraguariensis]|uniref:Shugoshin C-terminal domain-containing protein n=1 Tax=Ilex paraguariensis TaxID=185542 RepID=A0ABC8T5M5_9AQUA
MKGDRLAKRCSFGGIVKRRLSDITNSLPQPKSPINVEKPSLIDSSAKDYIDHLIKENMALMKLIADKNKIIELSGIELQKLRVSLQKLQLQNWNLAQSNGHVLAELNLGREKLKSLQHELVCKDASLKAKNVEFVGQGQLKGQTKGPKEEKDAIKKHILGGDSKPCNSNRRRSARSKSMGHSATSQQAAGEETTESKRRCLRRQSAGYKSHKQELVENLFEIEDAKFPIGSPMHEDGPAPSVSSVKKEDNDEKSTLGCEARDSKRTMGRPLRKAAEKVQSYKEIPLNIKMRRAG